MQKAEPNKKLTDGYLEHFKKPEPGLISGLSDVDFISEKPAVILIYELKQSRNFIRENESLDS